MKISQILKNVYALQMCSRLYFILFNLIICHKILLKIDIDSTDFDITSFISLSQPRSLGILNMVYHSDIFVLLFFQLVIP